MASYLDQYGAGEEKRETLIKRLVITVLVIAVFGPLLYYLFKNQHQVGEVNAFLKLVRAKDYKAAYEKWGCTAQTPCPGYAYEKFMEDWGPQSASGPLRITDTESCNAGVIIAVDLNPQREEKLWADKSTQALSFSPYPACPGKSPLANMIHQTVGKLRKPFLN